MTPTLLSNLRNTQSFDAVLKIGRGVSGIVQPYLSRVLYQTDAKKRDDDLAKLAAALLLYFTQTVQTAAMARGLRNALAVLKALAEAGIIPPDPQDLIALRTAIMDLSTRGTVRTDIIKAAIDDILNTLGNDLRRYYAEPGLTVAQKIAELRELEAEQQQKRLEYERALSDYYSGKTDTRPRRPQLQFAQAMIEALKDAMREQARRAGMDAELAAFAREGFETFTWITVNGAGACPDCVPRNGVVGNVAFWNKLGTPGSGRTICRQACFCMLAPSEVLSVDPSLSKGLTPDRKGVLTTADEMAMLDENRM